MFEEISQQHGPPQLAPGAERGSIGPAERPGRAAGRQGFGINRSPESESPPRGLAWDSDGDGLTMTAVALLVPVRGAARCLRGAAWHGTERLGRGEAWRGVDCSGAGWCGAARRGAAHAGGRESPAMRCSAG